MCQFAAGPPVSCTALRCRGRALQACYAVYHGACWARVVSMSHNLQSAPEPAPPIVGVAVWRASLRLLHPSNPPPCRVTALRMLPDFPTSCSLYKAKKNLCTRKHACGACTPPSWLLGGPATAAGCCLLVGRDGRLRALQLQRLHPTFQIKSITFPLACCHVGQRRHVVQGGRGREHHGRGAGRGARQEAVPRVSRQ